MATFAFASAPAAAARPAMASGSRAALAPRPAFSMRLSSGMTGTALRIAEVASRPAPRSRAQAFGPIARQGGQGGRGKPGDDEDDGFSERVVQVRRVTKVVKGGKQLSFRAVVSFAACAAAPAARAQPPCAQVAHLPAPLTPLSTRR